MDQNQMNKPVMGDASKTCNCTHHKIGPWALILAGVVVILGALNVLNSTWVMILIGVLLIVKGGVKIGGRQCNCCNRDKIMKM
jgi:hypothetical protein